MQSLPSDVPTGRKFDILLFDAFSNHCLANTIEPMRAANNLMRRDYYRWTIFTTDGNAVESSSGLRVSPAGPLAEGDGSTLIAMPSYGFRALADWSVISALKAAARRYDVVAGYDTGAWLLAAAGLLDGYRATIHWEEFTGFAEAFPYVDAERARFVIDRNRITCSGATAAYDLAIHLIRQAHGPLLTMEVGQIFMSESAGVAPVARSAFLGRLVRDAVLIMQEHLESPMTIREIAERLGVTQRRLEAEVRCELGATPQGVYRKLRLGLARKLVQETGYSVAEIASRTGYENAGAMTRAYRLEFDQTPREMRRQ